MQPATSCLQLPALLRAHLSLLQTSCSRSFRPSQYLVPHRVNPGLCYNYSSAGPAHRAYLRPTIVFIDVHESKPRMDR